MIDFRTDTTGLQAAERRFAGAERIYREELARGSADASRILQAETVKAAPRVTGRLQGSLTTVTEPIPNGFRVTTESRGVPYVRYVVEGTRAHLIEARFAKVLRWTAGGRTYFRFRVRHPGTKPNDFFARALAKARLPVRRVYQATNRRILVRLTRGN